MTKACWKSVIEIGSNSLNNNDSELSCEIWMLHQLKSGVEVNGGQWWLERTQTDKSVIGFSEVFHLHSSLPVSLKVDERIYEPGLSASSFCFSEKGRWVTPAMLIDTLVFTHIRNKLLLA